MIRRLSPEEVKAMFWRAREDAGGDAEAAAVLIYEAGRLSARAAARGERRRGLVNAEDLQAATADLREAVARHFDVKPGDLLAFSGGRSKLAFPRQVLMWLAREARRMTLVESAACCGRSDHTSAIDAIRAVEREIEMAPELRDVFLALAAQPAAERAAA